MLNFKSKVQWVYSLYIKRKYKKGGKMQVISSYVTDK